MRTLLSLNTEWESVLVPLYKLNEGYASTTSLPSRHQDLGLSRVTRVRRGKTGMDGDQVLLFVL